MSVHEDWLEKLADYKKSVLATTGKELHLPPPTNLELKIEYIEINPDKNMIGKIPFQERFTNPAGLYQGGFLAAALDEVFGPLAYISSGTVCMTLSLNLTFLKAFTPQMNEILVEAIILQKTKNFIFMRGEARSLAGDLIAFAESHVSILSPSTGGRP
jgi:acyl-coenzyme A thioesterase PaaI-like protein